MKTIVVAAYFFYFYFLYMIKFSRVLNNVGNVLKPPSIGSKTSLNFQSRVTTNNVYKRQGCNRRGFITFTGNYSFVGKNYEQQFLTRTRFSGLHSHSVRKNTLSCSTNRSKRSY